MSVRATISGLAIATIFMGILCSLLVTHERRPFYLVRERYGKWAQSFVEVEHRFRKGISLTQPLVQLYNQGRWSVLGAMPYPVVLPGRDGYLFYTSEEAKDGPTMTDWRGQALPDEAEITRWSEALITRDRHLAEQGIPYLVAMAPNKQTAMPQWLPRWVQHQEGRHRADVLLPTVADRLRTPPLDLRPLLRAESEAGRETYFRTDSHWNLEGAALAAEAIASRLGEIDRRVPALDTRGWERVACAYQGDILKLGHIKVERSETVLQPVPPKTLPACTPDGKPILGRGDERVFYLPVELWVPGEDGIKTLVLTNHAGVDGTLLVFHDSFGTGVMPFLGQIYRTTIACWSPWSQKIVDHAKPTVVLQLTVERYLHYIRRSGEKPEHYP